MWSPSFHSSHAWACPVLSFLISEWQGLEFWFIYFLPFFCFLDFLSLCRDWGAWALIRFIVYSLRHSQMWHIANVWINIWEYNMSHLWNVWIDIGEYNKSRAPHLWIQTFQLGSPSTTWQPMEEVSIISWNLGPWASCVHVPTKGQDLIISWSLL